jgi:hypothetical protein
MSVLSFFFLSFFFFCSAGVELRAYALSPPPALFCGGFFGIGSSELFSLASFKS